MSRQQGQRFTITCSTCGRTDSVPFEPDPRLPVYTDCSDDNTSNRIFKPMLRSLGVVVKSGFSKDHYLELLKETLKTRAFLTLILDEVDKLLEWPDPPILSEKSGFGDRIIMMSKENWAGSRPAEHDHSGQDEESSGD